MVTTRGVVAQMLTSDMGHSRHFDHAPLTSALPRLADVLRLSPHVSKVPILLQKALLGGDRNFSGPLMPFARGDMRDHIVSHQNDQGASYRRYGVLQWPRRPKINFCEIFDVVRFRLLQQYLPNRRHWLAYFLRRPGADEPDHRHCQLLRARRERPRCRRTAE